MRRFARELGVDLSKVNGSGPKGRITQDDLKNYVHTLASGGGATRGVKVPAWGGLKALAGRVASDFGIAVAVRRARNACRSHTLTF